MDQIEHINHDALQPGRPRPPPGLAPAERVRDAAGSTRLLQTSQRVEPHFVYLTEFPSAYPARLGQVLLGVAAILYRSLIILWHAQLSSIPPKPSQSGTKLCAFLWLHPGRRLARRPRRRNGRRTGS
jgi:hypothetical protein